MKKLRPALPAASRHPGRGRTEPGSALAMVLAGVLLAAAAAPVLQALASQTTASAAAQPAAQPSVPAIRARTLTAMEESTPAADALAGVVARRYRIAHGSARDVVRIAYREGKRHGVDPLLILAVVAVESRFNPIAESEQGAVGLMQIVPRFHKDKFAASGEAAMLQPHVNIAVGARILKDSIRRGGTETAGLQLYNGAVDDETRAYANRVLAERRRLEDAMPRTRDRA